MIARWSKRGEKLIQQRNELRACVKWVEFSLTVDSTFRHTENARVASGRVLISERRDGAEGLHLANGDLGEQEQRAVGARGQAISADGFAGLGACGLLHVCVTGEQHHLKRRRGGLLGVCTRGHF